MEHKHIFVALGLLALIIAGMFVFSYIKKSELAEKSTETTITEKPQVSPYAHITRIDAKHFFKNGTHTIVGEVPMPTSCDLLNWSTRMQESQPETVTIDFDVVNHAEICTQVVTPQRFKVSFDASEKAQIGATLEKRKVELNLIPGATNETPEDFELFIKG